MRIGFLFNHDQVHQVAHSLPIAIELAQAGAGAEIIVATTNKRLAEEVVQLSGGALPDGISHVELALSKSQWLANLLNTWVPAAKVLIYRDNLDFFRNLDLLVVTEKTSLVLKNRYGLRNLKLIYVRHGSGDRAIGFAKENSGFDHVLCSGPKIRDRLIADAGIDGHNISIVGYPKFDLAGRTRICPDVMKDGRPVVLYNPHLSPHLSSWYRHGRAVLDFFLENADYSLIFAPHVMLFERRIVVTIDRLRIDRPGRIDGKYLRAPNIHIDLGSRASTDMTYTDMANIYLGDVSSQIYEFLRIPRPCLFLNSHRVDHAHDANYAHWRAGPVIDHPRMLDLGLKRAMESHKTDYEPIQKRLFDYSFDLTETPSSRRAAEVIAKLGAQWAHST